MTKNGKTSSDIPVRPAPKFIYLATKAKEYVKIGPERYRAGDFFKMPAAEWPEESLAAVQRGMEQICLLKGYSRDNPFENIGINGFYALMATLHFECLNQTAYALDNRDYLDEMRMKHRVTGQEIVLYNLVPKPDL